MRVIKSDAFDQMAFESVAEYPTLAQLAKDESSLALVQDVFTSFYKLEPEVLDTESLTKDIMQEFLALKEYKDFHETSMLDAVPASFGAAQMAPGLLQKLQEIEEQIKQQREQQKEKNKLQNKDENEGVPDGMPRLSELSKDQQATLRQTMRKAIQKAQEETEDFQASMRQWGVDPGELKEMDALERLELADKLKKAGKLKNVANLLGRFKNVINASLATIPSHGSDEIVDIGTGDDLARMLPTEAIKLIQNPALFFKDYAEKNLLVYKLKGTDTLGKGPLMVAWDRSSSMEGEREAWATAVVLSLLHYAQKQKRAFAWVAFDSKVHAFDFYKKEAVVSLEKKMKIAQMGASGGTDFWAPIEKCMELHKQEPDLKPSDLIFITDGESEISDEQLSDILKWKKEKGIRIFSIGIGMEVLPTLEKFSDQICTVNHLGDVSPLRQAISIVHKD